MGHNTIREIREGLHMSKAELARKAELSPLTISRIEKGEPCRMETKKLFWRSDISFLIKTKFFPNIESGL